MPPLIGVLRVSSFTQRVDPEPGRELGVEEGGLLGHELAGAGDVADGFERGWADDERELGNWSIFRSRSTGGR